MFFKKKKATFSKSCENWRKILLTPFLLGEECEGGADEGDGPGEVVVVHAADEVRHEALSHIGVDTGEQELDQVEHTRPAADRDMEHYIRDQQPS